MMKLLIVPNGSPIWDPALPDGRGPRPCKGAPLGHSSCPKHRLLVYSNLVIYMYVYLSLKEIHILHLFLLSLPLMKVDGG